MPDGARPADGPHRPWWDIRPLDRVSSVRMKFAIVIVIAVGISATVSQVGYLFEIPVVFRPLIAMVLSMVMVRLVAHGLTAPLIEMEHAVAEMARGDYSVRVTASGADEVGRLASAFNAMAGELDEVERQRKDLIANVSHELRTPLSALQAKLENLVDGVESPDADVLSVMLAQTERLGRLVSQLLDLSRLESGALPLHSERVALASVLEQAAVEARMYRPGLEVHVEVTPTTLEVDADPERMHQVVANLLENAARHSPPGAAVELAGRSGAAGVVIEVADRGPGIAEADRSRVFERFYRADQSRSVDSGGTGLGLAIARWIVDLHGGVIRAEPRAPTGCRMVIELPS